MDSPHLAKYYAVRIDSIDDVAQLIGTGKGPLIFTLDDLAKDFFELRNGKAGEVFQKLTIYGIAAAFVIPEDHALGDRVTELAREHATHNLLRISPSIERAHGWIESLTQDKQEHFHG